MGQGQNPSGQGGLGKNPSRQGGPGQNPPGHGGLGQNRSGQGGPKRPFDVEITKFDWNSQFRLKFQRLVKILKSGQIYDFLSIEV